MDTHTPRLNSRKALQLGTLVPIPVTLAFAFAFFRFGLHSRTVTTMEQRKNRVLAQDALRVPQALADLYGHGAGAGRALSVLPNYFDRFLSFSLLPGEVAVFRAANLSKGPIYFGGTSKFAHCALCSSRHGGLCRRRLCDGILEGA